MTFHDSCNNARSCGLTEEPRELLKLVCEDFREMYPNRAENYCCTGGGGAMSMSEYTPRRLKSAEVKANQLKETGAKVVVTSCHNCVDGLSDCIRHYELGMDVTQLVNLVAKALVIEKPAEVPVPEVVAEPAVAVEVPVEAPPEPVAVGSELAGKTILVADDEPDFVAFVAAMLEDNDVTVIKAYSGPEAIEKAKAEKPDLITLHISMPGMSGEQVFEAFRKDDELKDVPVCIVTGRPELRKLIYERSVVPPEGFIDKPITEESFLLNLRKTLMTVH